MRSARELTAVEPPGVEERLWSQQHAGLNVLTRLAIGSEGAQPRASAATAAPAQAAPQRSHRRRWGALERSRWLLPAVLAIQAVLSLRLVWSNTAFQDEALYLWSGHLEWSHWRYGTPMPVFPAYFSGVPVIYPPLGAYADAVAGLAGARILSLCFMLLTTTMLHGVTRRIFGRRSAFFAAGLFASMGASQFLGAFATYDAMALMLLALATWLGIRAADRNVVGEVALIVASAAVLVVADASKYAAALFDPVVIATVTLAAWRIPGRNVAIRMILVFGVTLCLFLFTAIRIGGPSYWHGITTTTLSRNTGNSSAFGIWYMSVAWAGAVMALALIGAAVTFFTSREMPTRLLALPLLTASFLAPAEQARIHVFTSLFKHVGYGAWFGCILGGYALACFVRAVPAIKANAAETVSVATVAIAAVLGAVLATNHFTWGWPDSTRYMAALRPWAASSHGQMLFGNAGVGNIPEYYSPGTVRWTHVTGEFYFAYTDPDTGKRIVQPALAYADAIRHGYFALISLTGDDSLGSYDQEIRQDIRRYGDRYRLVVDLPYRLADGARGAFLVWVRTAAQ